MLRILLVDDHPIVRKGLKSIIEDSDLEHICYEAGNEEETTRVLKENHVDLIVLDISLGKDSGFFILEKIKKSEPNTKVLMISALSEDTYADKAIKSGADGFIPKETAPEELIFAIKRIMSGDMYLSNSLTSKFVKSKYYNTVKKPHESLSERELDVLFLMAKGYKGVEIAEKLFVSKNTVSTYRARIMQKLELNSNVELLKYCLDNNLC